MQTYFLNTLKKYTEDIPSLYLLLLPYIIITYGDIKDAEAFSYLYFFLILGLLLLFDIVYYKLFQKIHTNRKFIIQIIHFIYVVFFVVFYSYFFIPHLVKFFFEYDFVLRWRLIIITMFLFVWVIILITNNIYTYLNRFLIILSLIILINYSYAFTKKSITKQKNTKRILNIIHHSDKPIIFIILDEYASPAVFEKANIIKKTPDLADYLDSNGWITKKIFYSAETSTIHSISSVFNYNLSENDTYSNSNIIKVSDYLKNSSVIENLNSRNISFKNYSFFTITHYQYYFYLYPFPCNFFDDFMVNSIYLPMKVSTQLKLSGADMDYFAALDYNQKIYNLIISTMGKPGLPRQLIYLHLLMPHIPFHFSNEINLTGYSTNNYYQYWLFTNKKIINALKQAKYLNDYRIIISGDHGFRNDKRINPHQTLTAFYGFDQKDVDKLHSVQDIGALIDGSFK